MKQWHRAPPRANETAAWWERPDLGFDAGTLHFCGRSVENLTRWSDDPVFLYSAPRALANIRQVRSAIEYSGVVGDVLFAMKANRFAPLLTVLATSGECGIDVCSPNEVKAAMAAGFRAEQLSYTGTSPSDADLDFLVRHPDVWINCDSLTVLRRLGMRARGRAIGLRINPEIGVGQSAQLTYSGGKATKFGIYREQWAEALAIADAHRLSIEKLHFHVGCGFLNDQLVDWEEALRRVMELGRTLPALRTINLGGGLGVPHVAGAIPFDLDGWSNALARGFAGSGLSLEVEPGDYIVKDAGMLVLSVTGVERKGGTRFVFLNGGFNLAPEPAFYNLPCEPVPCRQVVDGIQFENTTIAGNINEALDLWYEDFPFPPVQEGQRIALLNAGGYASSMSSNHCLRGDFHELLLL